MLAIFLGARGEVLHLWAKKVLRHRLARAMSMWRPVRARAETCGPNQVGVHLHLARIKLATFSVWG